MNPSGMLTHDSRFVRGKTTKNTPAASDRTQIDELVATRFAAHEKRINDKIDELGRMVAKHLGDEPPKPMEKIQMENATPTVSMWQSVKSKASTVASYLGSKRVNTEDKKDEK